MHEEEKSYCGYEHCERPLKIKPGHRRKQYCNDTCRQAAHRLRVEREQASKKASLDSYLSKYHSPRLRSILEYVLKEQGASDVLRLMVAIDEERTHAQASDEMQKRVASLEIQLSEYRTIVDLDDRARIVQQFLSVGQLLDYRALDTFRIGKGSDCWADYASWTYEATLADVVVAGRAIVEEEMAARNRAQEKSRLRQVEQELADTKRELATYLSPPRELVECSLRRWSTLTNLFAHGKKLIGQDLDAFIHQASDQLLVKELEIAQACYFTEKYHQRRIAIIQQQLNDVEPYRGDPALSLVSMDDQGYVTFATGDRKWMDVEDIRDFWARIVGKQGQRSVGTTNVAAIQQYLCDHAGEHIEIQRGNKTVRIVVLDNDGMAATETLQVVHLDEQDIEQARRWVQQHTQVNAHR